MLTAVVLICSLAITPDLASCDRHNAVNVVRVPAGFANATTCLLHGQAYLAETTLGRELATDERIKVVCSSRPSTAAMPPATGR
jgi:hypothetical protein